MPNGHPFCHSRAYRNHAIIGGMDSQRLVYATLVAEPNAPRFARRFVEHAAHTWKRTPVADEAALVTSELVTNAVDAATTNGAPHPWEVGARHMIGLALQTLPRGVLVCVTDQLPGTPHTTPARCDDGQGRGLRLVEEFSTTWGWEFLNYGKVVWARVERDLPSRTPGASNPSASKIPSESGEVLRRVLNGLLQMP